MRTIPPLPYYINPKRAMPAEQAERSVDFPGGDDSPGGGGSFPLPPLLFSKVDSTNVIVSLGTVNGIIPTGVATNIDVSGTDGTWSIYLHATLGSDGIPTAVEILSGTTGVPADDSSNSYMLLGQAVVVSAVITSAAATLWMSQTFVTCGRNSADPTTTPGTYYWQVA